MVPVKKGMDRTAMLTALLSQDPNNALARYGLAMEYSNAGDIDRALREFATLLSANPEYTAGYFMAAQTLAKAARTEQAKEMLVQGIATAKRTGDSHAMSEMQDMLDRME